MIIRCCRLCDREALLLSADREALTSEFGEAHSIRVSAATEQGASSVERCKAQIAILVLQ